MTDSIVTIGIKALNEERRIGECLAACVEAVRRVGGDIVLADSGSTDRTVEIARQFPVRIVRFADLRERGCGAGAQLAFQHATGRYFYLLDGDMVPRPDFLERAVAYLDRNPGVAGVGGQMEELNVANLEFAKRVDAQARDPDWRPGPVSRLDGGGVYRVAAVRSLGYLADRNLHAFEEFDLAARLRAAGWELHRIEDLAMDHFGHDVAGYPLMWRRFRSGYAGAAGEVLRGAIGRPHLPIVLRLGHVRNAALVYPWWAALLGSVLAGPSIAAVAWPALLAAPLLLLRWRQGAWDRALYTFAMWNTVAAGSIGGFLRARRNPASSIAAIDLGASGDELAQPQPQEPREEARP